MVSFSEVRGAEPSSLSSSPACSPHAAQVREFLRAEEAPLRLKWTTKAPGPKAGRELSGVMLTCLGELGPKVRGGEEVRAIPSYAFLLGKL